jgi:hypothetical protein
LCHCPISAITWNYRLCCRDFQILNRILDRPFPSWELISQFGRESTLLKDFYWRHLTRIPHAPFSIRKRRGATSQQGLPFCPSLSWSLNVPAIRNPNSLKFYTVLSLTLYKYPNCV